MAAANEPVRISPPRHVTRRPRGQLQALVARTSGDGAGLVEGLDGKRRRAAAAWISSPKNLARSVRHRPQSGQHPHFGGTC